MASERTVAVVPAAGRGERMGGATNKAFLLLGDRPLLAHALGVLETCPLVDEIVVAVGEGEEDACRREVLEPFELRKVTGVIRGGASRQESVRLALRYVGTGAGLVVIHDGARPLLPHELLVRTIEAGRRSGAAVVGLPVKDTVKRVDADGHVAETLDRRRLWQIQTPQVFWRDLIQMAHARAAERGVIATDDAALVELLRHPVLVLEGLEENIKVTTPLDLLTARAILASREKARA